MKYIDFLKQDIEIREEGEEKVVSGFIPYNTRSLPMGFVETIKPSAFNKTLADGADVKALYNHDSSRVLGRVKNNTLVFRNQDNGLSFDVRLNENITFHKDLYESIRTGNVDGVSFGFSIVKDNVRKESDKIVRELVEVRLHEVSVGVAFPAYPDSESYVRELKEEIKDRLIEENQPDKTTDKETEIRADEENEKEKEQNQENERVRIKTTLDRIEREFQLLKNNT